MGIEELQSAKERNTAMTEDADKRRCELYDEHQRQTWQDIQSSTDNFDKNVLAVSSAALGFSLVFIKDFVHLPTATWRPVLYTSWLCFATCIVITVFSFRLSVAALNKHLEYLREYYEKQNEEFLTKKSATGKMLDVFTWVAATLFLGGIICTMIFCIKNVGKETEVNKNEKVVRVREGRAPLALTPVQQDLEKGRSPIAVTPISGAEERGRQPVNITPVRPATPQPATPASDSGSSAGGASNTGGSGNSAGENS